MLNTLIDPPPASAPRVLETAPLFVHTLWRTGGTYVWNKLRRGAFWAYHEPFHELLLTARPDQLEAQFQDNFSGRLRHPETERQYFHEFPAAPTGGVPFFAKSFSYDDYWLPETHAHPALRHYLQHLLSHAADQGRRPAAKFCRSALRLGWLRQNFPAAHWGLLRAPRAQWESYLSFAGKYFTTATLLVAGKTAHAPVMQPLQAALPVPRLDAETVAEELQAYAHLLPHFELDQQYFVFYYLWLAFLMEAAEATDLILDLDLIQADAGARQALEARCAEVFAAPLDFADIRLPAYSQLSQPAEELQRVEAAVLACFSRELGDSYRARLTRFDPAAAPLSSAYRRLIDSVLAGRPLPAPPAFSFPAGPRPVDRLAQAWWTAMRPATAPAPAAPATAAPAAADHGANAGDDDVRRQLGFRAGLRRALTPAELAAAAEYLTAGLASEDVVAYVEAHPAGFTKAVLALLVTNAEQALADGNRPLARTLFQIEEVLTTLNPVPLPAEPAGAPNVSQFVRQANDLFLGGDLAGARAALDQALQLAPDDAQLLLAQGNLALRQGDLAAARREFARAVTAAPGTAAPHLNLAAVLSLLNETAEAEAEAQRALAIQPEHPEAWKLLGQLHGQAQRWLDAGQCYSRALQAQPRDVEALVGLGVARWQAGDLAAAQTCCEQALAVDPTHAAARQLVARVQQAAQKPLNGAAPTHAAGRLSLAEVLAELEKLPSHWHAAGTLHIDVLRHIAQWAGGRAIQHTAETGTGKSTVLFSHLSPDHKVFAIDNGNTDSLPIVQGSSLLDHTHVEFILGPTQLTLPQHRFPHKLQIVLIDGPHGYPFPDLEYYYFYPWLDEGGLLIVDDIHIPTVRHMYEFIKADKMFRPAGMVHTTAFFERTTAPVFDPTGDGWWEQRYNKLHFPDRPMLVNIDLRRAKGRLAGGDLAGAREALLDLLELEPRHAEALSLLNTLRQPAN